MNTWLQKMSPRERLLASLVAGILFLLANLVLLKVIASRQAELRSQLAGKELALNALETLATQKELWTKRDAWLHEKQPPLGSREMAGVELLEQLRVLAAKSGVTIVNPTIGTFEKTSFYEASPVTLETKSSWTSLIHFLATLQPPENFMAVESADLKIDPEDATAMHGTFTIAKWCAPAPAD